jgi:hypothetical protein
MTTMTEITIDKRVDELSKRVDRGFEQTDIRFADLRSEMHQGFARTDKRIDDLRTEMHQGFNRSDADFREIRSGIASLQRLMVGFFATTLGSIIAGFAVLFLSHH